MQKLRMWKKGKGRRWGPLALQPYGFLYPDPKGVPSFISRGAASASEGRNYEWKFCLRSSNSHRSQGSFTSPPKEGMLRIFNTH
jgi:hypothetical protein